MSLFQRLRSRHAGMLQQRSLLPSGARWSDQKEDGELQPGSSRTAADSEQQPQPPRLRLSSLVPDIVSSYVFLGFSQSGSFVWSYRQGDSSRPGEDCEWFYLQVWGWRQEQPLVLLLSEPFYRCQDADDELGDSEHPVIVVLDSDDDSCVVVYAYKRPRRGDEWSTYHFCLLPLPVLPLPRSTTAWSAVPGTARVAVASHRFTCDCQWEEVPRSPVSLHLVPEPTVSSAGRHLLLVQTSTAVHSLRFDTINLNSSSSTTSTANTRDSSSSLDSTSDNNSSASSLLRFRSDQRVLGSRSWTCEQQRVATDSSSVQWRVVVRSESSLDVEWLIASVDEFDDDFRLRDYHLLNPKLVSWHTHTNRLISKRALWYHL